MSDAWRYAGAVPQPGTTLSSTANAPVRIALASEPLSLLAVVEDERGRQWYRWAAGRMHTSVPWALLGAVHADTVGSPGYECYRWEDLPPVHMVSPGVTRDSFVAVWQ